MPQYSAGELGRSQRGSEKGGREGNERRIDKGRGGGSVVFAR